MAKHVEIARQADSYENFKYRVKWDGRYVAGVSKIDALTRTSQVVSHRAGGDPHSGVKSPGQVDYGPITMERGITHDVAFEQWANKVWDYANSGKLGQEVSLKDFRKNIIVELYNESGQMVMAYNIYKCWVSEFTAMPELDANGNAVAIQSITIQNEGWERDTSVKEPSELEFRFPSDKAKDHR